MQRVVIVTGAAGSLGSAYCNAFAKLGYSIVANDIPIPALDELVNKLSSEGCSIASNCDSVEEGEKIVKFTIERFGRVDVVVNNAGIYLNSMCGETPIEQWNKVNDVNYNGAFRITQEAWKHMQKQQYGRIIFTASTFGMFAYQNLASYCSSKAAVIGLTKALALEGDSHNIKVNAIAPHAASRMLDHFGLKKETLDAIGPEYVAPYVTLLSSEKCPCNGELFHIAGGYCGRFEWIRSTGVRLRLEDATHENILANWANMNSFVIDDVCTDRVWYDTIDDGCFKCIDRPFNEISK